MLRELAKMVSAGRASAVEVVQRALDRIERANDDLNAVVGLRAEEALAEARALDERGARGERLGPLAGVPFLVKDNHDLAGMRTTQGSLLLEDVAPAARDCLHVARLRAAGAIPVGKTNVPEFCFEGFTANRLFGVTSNPWAPEWSPGGSSGGSAAAMAAAMVPFATATDGAGSIRIPAAFCGLFGLKASNGVIPRSPIPTWMDLSTDGPLALSMDDLRLLLSIEAGPAPGDPTALPVAVIKDMLAEGEGAGGAAHGPRPSRVLAAPRMVDWGPLPDSIADQFDAALTRLEKDLGLAVEPVEPGRILKNGNADEDSFLTFAVEQLCDLGRETVESNLERFHPGFREAMEEALGFTLEDYLAVRRRRFAYARDLDELLGDGRILVTPTMACEGFLADGTEPGGAGQNTGLPPYNTAVQNLTGHPALSVPAGRSANGVPFGLQITGPRFRDDLVLAVGEAWEQAHPSPGAAPGYAAFL